MSRFHCNVGGWQLCITGFPCSTPPPSLPMQKHEHPAAHRSKKRTRCELEQEMMSYIQATKRGSMSLLWHAYGHTHTHTHAIANTHLFHAHIYTRNHSCCINGMRMALPGRFIVPWQPRWPCGLAQHHEEMYRLGLHVCLLMRFWHQGQAAITRALLILIVSYC